MDSWESGHEFTLLFAVQHWTEAENAAQSCEKSKIRQTSHPATARAVNFTNLRCLTQARLHVHFMNFMMMPGIKPLQLSQVLEMVARKGDCL